ncbi:ABC transporter permease [Anaeromyxobacter sp. Fw109-5]|uniref:ABC transporter permease n=1 Tax=Anaeromyxobacter sp. (strain Fw109-5) TaxID=404589 RepID=UPI00059C67CB|nr:ABC transporter permease [Anaeromyxobacter sp. Fw109-5]
MSRALVRVYAMAAKEARHILRDPRTLYMSLGMPVLLLFLFGYGVAFDIDRIPLAVVDQDRTASSRELVRALTASRELVAAGELADPAAALGAFRRGRASAALVVEEGYERAVLAREVVPVQLLVDGADALVANQLLAKAEALVRAESQRLGRAEVGARRPPVQVKVWTRYNPEGRSAFYMVPGLAAYLLAITAVLLTALTIAGEWERGSMEQLFASPIGRLEIVLGKLLPYLALGLLEFLLVVAFGMTAFDLPMRGSAIALALLGLVFLVGMLGQGLLVSVLAKNQTVATQAGVMSSLLPSLLLSGMIFPIENMPLPLQQVSRVIPARYLVHGLRGVLLKGNALDVLWPDLLALSIFAVVVIALATARFQRRLA